MNRCPITYASCQDLYSPKGLKLLSKNLTKLEKLPFSSLGLRKEASARAGKISIQGVQPKLSARINIKMRSFEIVNEKGHYILKPQISDFEQVPENEDLTMRMASISGIEVPLHGMIYGLDNELTYFIRRFDRTLRNQKTHTEDFAQLAGKTRDTKYNSSMEQVIKIIDEFCTFPAVEKLKLFKIILFCFLVGNEDMHLKNFSIIRNKNIITLSPSYDLLNTSIILPNPSEELALPLNGKKNRIKKHDLIDYFGKERLDLPIKVINKTLKDLEKVQNIWHRLIDKSFLQEMRKDGYKNLIHNRCKRLF